MNSPRQVTEKYDSSHSYDYFQNSSYFYLSNWKMLKARQAALRRLFYSTFLFSINLSGQKHPLQHIYAKDKKALNPNGVGAGGRDK